MNYHANPNINALLHRLVSPNLAVIDLSLDRIHSLLAALGNPHRGLPPVIHIAGTNGKGSLAAYLTAILQAAGYGVHRYISPHLVRFNERIMLNGADIDDGQLEQVLAQVELQTHAHPVTFFEATTAAAFLAFAQTPADIVILETGLGGRLDATNVIDAPALTAITPVSMDHMEYMGNKLSGIAAEKAGIIKRFVTCVTGPQVPEAADILKAAADEKAAPLYRFGREWHTAAEGPVFRYRSLMREQVFPLPNLAGAHQVANAGTAIACLDRLAGFDVTDNAIRRGLQNAQWPARLQPITSGPLAARLPMGSELWLDGGHNAGAGEVLAVWAKDRGKPLHVICGMLKNKETAQFLAPLAPFVQSLTGVAISGEPQSQAAETIARLAAAAGIPQVTALKDSDIKSAIEHIVNKQKNDIIILICGSLYLAGNILLLNSPSG